MVIANSIQQKVKTELIVKANAVFSPGLHLKKQEMSFAYWFLKVHSAQNGIDPYIMNLKRELRFKGRQKEDGEIREGCCRQGRERGSNFL